MAETTFDDHVREPAEDWKPATPLVPAPICVWPPRPRALLRYFFGFPGYFLPWNALYYALAFATWFILMPPLETMKTFGLDWIAHLLALNVGLMFLVCGAWHFRFYIRRAQGDRFMMNKEVPLAQHRRFLFGRQIWDNMFWSVVSGCGILTAYEVVTFWAMANGYIPYLSWEAHPVFFVLIFCLLPIYRDVHFYFIHRLLHYRFLYRTAHYLHHKNVDTGPWSGNSMHPVEHMIFYTALLLHWVVATHPVHLVFHVQHLILSPALGHLGFDEMELANGKRMSLGQRYFHALHHKHFECNYGGDGTIPLDRWFGTWHDGTPESEARITERLQRANGGA